MRKQRGPEIKPGLKEILDVYNIDANDEDWCWDCHGTLVLTHRAYEIIAAKENIQFDHPMVINSAVRDPDTFSVAIAVTARMGDRVDWSIGEASPMNYSDRSASKKMALYPYAMAEKRAKDRVIAKLVGLSAYCYSEEEAAEFKDAKPTKAAEAETKSADTEPSSDKIADWTKKVLAALANAKTPEDIDALLERCELGLKQADRDDRATANDIRARFTARRLILEKANAA